jgi:aryl-alcohol dehydrogenase-like predicted oxidoreductase
LQYGSLGSTGLTVSAVGFGAARFCESFYDSSEQEMIALLRAAYDQGITFYDTADMYTQGRSERLLGKAFGPRQKDVVISSKVGYTVSAKSKLVSQAKALVVPLFKRLGVPRPQRPLSDATPASPMPQDFSPAAIRTGLEGSLRRLQRDCLDVYLLHGMPDVHGVAAAFSTLNDLKTEGKIRHFGASCEILEDVSRALAIPGLEVIQVSLSLLEFDALPLIREARRKSIGIVARKCYASGALAKPMVGVGRGGAAIIDKYRAIATAHGRSLPELAFHYVNDCPLVDVTLIGARLRKHLDDAIAFAGKPSLSAAEMADLAAVGAPDYDRTV